MFFWNLFIGIESWCSPYQWFYLAVISAERYAKTIKVVVSKSGDFDERRRHTSAEGAGS